MKFKPLIFLSFFLLFCAGCATTPYRPVTSSKGTYHIVGSGQNLYRIAKVYGVDVQDIMRANNIKNSNQIGVGERLLIPGAPSLVYLEPRRPQVNESVESLVGEKQYRVKWKTITLHHSATKEGNAESFDRNHRYRKMGGLFYHFVIGNGSESGDGEIEVGWRWRKQAEVNRRRDINICLVGDFNRQQVSQAQFNALVQLIRALQAQYSIPITNIRRHKDIPGSFTECPGRNFPYYKILAELRRD